MSKQSFPANDTILTVLVDQKLAIELLKNESACNSEGIGGDTTVLVDLINSAFPELVGNVHY